jgi:hypothetical protein
MEKCGRAIPATDDNIIQQTHFVYWITKAIDTHTLRIYNTSCFCMATVVMQMCLNFMFKRTLPVLLKLYHALCQSVMF